MPLLDPTTALLVLARVAGLVLASPIFGHVLVPLRVRAGLTALVAVALTPTVPPVALPAAATMWTLGGAVAVESVIGVLLGLVAQLVFAGVQLGGQLAGIQMGFGIANMIDPQSHAQVTIVALWQQLLALLIFLVLDMHHVLLGALVESFRVAPPGTVVLAGATLAGVVAQAGGVFGLGVRLAAPVIITLLLTNAAFGVLARTVPQLNVFVVGFPVNVGVGLVVLGASLPFAVRCLMGRFGELGGVLGGLIGGLVRG
jgi:flagellar biosynthetic protein FliR